MFDVIVVGGGPAGITAALYAVRSGKSVLILEANAFGGQIATAPKVENFPSVKQIAGAELSEKMFEQAVDHGVEFDMGTATVQKAEKGFTVTTEYSTYECLSVVLATGVSHRKLDIPSEEQFAGRGVCYCAVCDGAFYAGKDVCVVGDGNSAAQYSLYLADLCKGVTLLTLTEKLFCDAELSARILANDKIEWIKNVSVTEIVGDETVKGVAVKDVDGAITYVDVDGVFVAIGQVPHNDAFADLVKLDERGYIVASEDCQTTCDGVFAAGDCRTKRIRQCTTAVGDGAVAGFSAAMFADKVKSQNQ